MQLVTVRLIGTFLEDPIDVPTSAVDFVAGKLGIEDPSCLKLKVRASGKSLPGIPVGPVAGQRGHILRLHRSVSARSWLLVCTARHS